MPDRAPQHRPARRASSFTRRQADRARRERDGKRFHSTGEWQRLRAMVLRQEPRCRPCRRAGRLTVATEVDHVTPIGQGGDKRDRRNLQSICRDCHIAKTSAERGFGPQALADLKPSAIPLTIVCGPPGSGKSTYVAKRAGVMDLVIDLDEIVARLSGKPIYHDKHKWLAPAMAERNRMLWSLADDRRHDAAWLIVGAPRAAFRLAWSERLRAREVVVFETPAMVCQLRIRNDHRRDGTDAADEEPVLTWWRRYERRDGETILHR
ncbi:MAG: HNH endonuclease [Sphingomonadales bacterium]